MRRQILIACLTAFLGMLPFTAQAQEGSTEGEVRRVDKATGKITLRHGPIAGALEMPAMSMVFQSKDPALLDRLKTGDRGRFRILKEDGVFWIVAAEPAS